MTRLMLWSQNEKVYLIEKSRRVLKNVQGFKNAESSSKLHCRREGIKIFKKKEIISKVYIGFCQAWFISELFIFTHQELTWKRSMVLRKSHECVLHRIWFSFVCVRQAGLIYKWSLIHSGL